MKTKFLTLLALVALGFTSAAQTITGITPGSGNRGQTLPLIVSGQNTNFSNQATGTLYLKQGSYTITSGTVTVQNPNQVNTVVNIPNNAPLGFYDLFLSKGQTYTKSAAFEIKQGTNTANMSVNPAGSQPGNTISNVYFNIPGAAFKTLGAGIENVWLSRSGLVINTATNISVINGNSFNADIIIPSGTSLGKWTVNVSTSDGNTYTKNDGFLISQDFSEGEWGISLNEFIIYPNPTSDYLNLEFSQNLNSGLSVRVMQLNGQLMKAAYEVDYDGQSIKTDVRDLANGTYIIQLVYKNQILSSKKWIHD